MTHGYRFILVDDYDKATKFLKFLEDCDEPLGFDTESSGVEALKVSKGKLVKAKMLNMHSRSTTLTGFSVAQKSTKRAWYVPLGHQFGNAPESLLGAFMRVLVSKNLYIHNLSHELKALGLAKEGYRFVPPGWEDTCVMAWVASMKGAKGFGLKDLTPKYLGWTMTSFSEVTKGASFGSLLPEQGLAYACEDAIAACELAEIFKAKLAAEGLTDVYSSERSFIDSLNEAESNGFHVDVAGVISLKDELVPLRKALYAQWCELAPVIHAPPRVWRWVNTKNARVPRQDEESYKVSPNSPKDLQVLWHRGYFSEEGAPTSDKTKDFSTSADALEHQLDVLPAESQGYKLAKILVEMKVIDKNLTSFTDGYIVAATHSHDGRIHPSFKLHGTSTGRLSCSDPNLQQVPSRSEIGKRIRKLFTAPEGSKLVVADYGQLEYRVGAHYTKQGYLYDCFKNGIDPHGVTQQKFAHINMDRAGAKRLNFKGFYGGSMMNESHLGLDKDGLWELQKELEETFRHERDMFKRIDQAVIARGYVRNLFGFRRYLPKAQLVCSIRHNKDNSKYDCPVCSAQAGAIRQARNAVIQGTGAGITKRAMKMFLDELRAKKLVPAVKLLGQVHDEILAEAEDGFEGAAKEILEHSMLRAASESGIQIPMAVEAKIGNSWGDCK